MGAVPVDVVDDVGPVPLDHVEQERDEHSEGAPSDRVERLPSIATTAPDEVYLQVVGVLIRTPLDRDRRARIRATERLLHAALQAEGGCACRTGGRRPLTPKLRRGGGCCHGA